MKNVTKSKIIKIIGIIFFLTSIAAKVNNIYISSKVYNNKDTEIKSKNSISKEEKEKILELTKTMDEGMAYLNNDKTSNTVKMQLIKDMIDSVNVINKKLNIRADILIEELNKQYDDLNDNKNMSLEKLLQLYNEWKEKVLI